MLHLPAPRSPRPPAAPSLPPPSSAVRCGCEHPRVYLNLAPCHRSFPASHAFAPMRVGIGRCSHARLDRHVATGPFAAVHALSVWRGDLGIHEPARHWAANVRHLPPQAHIHYPRNDFASSICFKEDNVGSVVVLFCFRG